MCVQVQTRSPLILTLSSNRKFSHEKLPVWVARRAKICRTEREEAHKVLNEKSVGARSSFEIKTTHHERRAWLFKAFTHLNALVSMEHSVKLNAPTGPRVFITWGKFPGASVGLPLSSRSPIRTVVRGAVS